MKKFLSLVLVLLLVSVLCAGCITPTPPDNGGTPKTPSIRDYLKNVSKSLLEYDAIGIAPKGFSVSVSNEPRFASPMNADGEDNGGIVDEEDPFNELTEDDFNEEPATLYGRVGKFVEEILFKSDDGEDGSITDYGFEVIQLYQTDTFIAFAISEYTEIQVDGRTVINRVNSISFTGDSVRFESGIPFITDVVYGRVYEGDADSFSISDDLIIKNDKCVRVSFSETEMTETIINPRGGDLRGVYNGVPVFYGSDLTASDTVNRVEYVSKYYEMDYAAFDGNTDDLYCVRWWQDDFYDSHHWIVDIYFNSSWVSVVEFLEMDILFYNSYFAVVPLGYGDYGLKALMGVSDGELLFVKDTTYGATPSYAWDQANKLVYTYSYEDVDSIMYVGETEIALKQFVREYSFSYVDSGTTRYYICYDGGIPLWAYDSISDSLRVFMYQHHGLYKLETSLDGGKWYYLESVAGNNDPVWILISDYVQENEVRTQLPII